MGNIISTSTSGDDTSSSGVVDVASRTAAYISNRRLLLSLGDAGSRLMYSGKDLAELSGYTSRVYSLLASLHALDEDDYPRHPRPESFSPTKRFYDLGDVRGRVILGPQHVLLKNVPIVAPAGGAAGAERGGEELIRSLDIRVEKGEHTLITGPNGVGKTAIARVIAELWPTWSGLLERPLHGEGGIFFLPQKPYLAIGSLRDQVIYPHTYAEMKARGRTDAELMSILEHVHLAYLPSREGGWETRKEWKDVLSGGEKQRMGMARLFYHRPTYAVLDECTSAVSTDVEGLMYEHAKSLGITLITISHRPSLLKYHNRHLRLGEPTLAPSLSTANLQSLRTPTTPLASQGWQLTKISSAHTHEERLELDMEIERLENMLGKDVNEWQKRLDVVTRELKGEAPKPGAGAVDGAKDGATKAGPKVGAEGEGDEGVGGGEGVTAAKKAEEAEKAEEAQAVEEIATTEQVEAAGERQVTGDAESETKDISETDSNTDMGPKAPTASEIPERSADSAPAQGEEQDTPAAAKEHPAQHHQKHKRKHHKRAK